MDFLIVKKTALFNFGSNFVLARCSLNHVWVGLCNTMQGLPRLRTRRATGVIGFCMTA